VFIWQPIVQMLKVAMLSPAASTPNRGVRRSISTGQRD
jgi:hypothetical protein